MNHLEKSNEFVGNLPPRFNSFWMGGFEGADHVNSHGIPLHMNESNQHSRLYWQDYEAAARLGIRTVRESIGWRVGTDPAGKLDINRIHLMLDAAHHHGVQIIWTLHHYGVPAGVDFFAPDFAERFADFCDQVGRAVKGRGEAPTLFQPINEISFLSWAAGHTNLIHPHLGESNPRGYELKCLLVAAALKGCDALWANEPLARMVHTDPLIHVAPDTNAMDQHQMEMWAAQAHAHTESQFEAWDMLCGRREPGLGGAPHYLDVVGVNYYHDNQWLYPSHSRLHWHLNDARRRPLEDLLADVWTRYRRPLFMAETGHVGAGRARWLQCVAAGAEKAMAQGVPLLGICLYPLLDRPDWEQPAHWHRSGLWEVRGHCHRYEEALCETPSLSLTLSGLQRKEVLPQGMPSGVADRALHLPLAHELKRWQSVLPPFACAHANPISRAPPQGSLSVNGLDSLTFKENAMQLSPSHLSSQLAKTMPPSPNETTLIVYSHLRWDFVYQRPQQLLSRMGRQMPVLFIEEPVPGAAFPTLEIMDPEPGVRVLRAHVTTLGSGFADAHTPQVQSLVQAYLKSHAISQYWLWFYTPMALPLAAQLQPQGIIYDCMDELSAFHFAPRELLQREDALFDQADLVFTGGFSLYEAKAARHPSVHCFPSSVDVSHFARVKRLGHPDHVAQAHLLRPRLGYFGVIDERIDLDLVAHIADARSDWQVIMVGPVVKIDPALLPQRVNLHWMGQRDYAELPEFVGGWDVCLMPFALNDSTRFISPTKTLEYLAAGRPVVSTPIRDVVRPYASVVAIADHPDAFVRACESALTRSPESAAAEDAAVQTLLARTSWDRTVASMLYQMQEHKAAELANWLSADVSGAGKSNVVPGLSRPSAVI